MKYPCQWGVKDKIQGQHMSFTLPLVVDAESPLVIQGRQKERGPVCGIHTTPFEMKRNKGQCVGSHCLLIEMERNRGQ